MFILLEGHGQKSFNIPKIILKILRTIWVKFLKDTLAISK